MTVCNVKHFIHCTIVLMMVGLVLGLAGCSKKAVKTLSPGAVAGGETSDSAGTGGHVGGSISSGTPGGMTEAMGAQLRVGEGGVLSEFSGEGEIGTRGGQELIVVQPTEMGGESSGPGEAEHISEPLVYAEVQPNLLVGVGTSAIETAAVSAPAEGTFFVKEGFENIYFDFNRWAIPTPMVERLTAHASWLRAHSGSKVHIEGHCDIRGSREYNMVLGERRARSVKDFLLDLGVNEVQLSLISYGKERLTCFEGKEGCHQENRRAHLMLK